MDLTKLCSVEEAAEILSRTPALVRKFCREKRFKATQLNQHTWAIDRKDLERFRNQERPSGRPPQNRKKKNQK